MNRLENKVNQGIEEYNSQNNYEVGDYVFHNDEFFECIMPCINEEWNETHWNKTTVLKELREKTDLGYVTPEMFGASGIQNQNEQDDEAFRKAIDAAQRLKIPLYLKGEYNIHNPIVIKNRIKITRGPRGIIHYYGRGLGYKKITPEGRANLDNLDPLDSNTLNLNKYYSVEQDGNEQLILPKVYAITFAAPGQNFEGEQGELPYPNGFYDNDQNHFVMFLDIDIYIVYEKTSNAADAYLYDVGGVRVCNSMRGSFRIKATGFSVGFNLFGYRHDCDYNLVYPEYLLNNRVGILISTGDYPDDKGFVNQNLFYGGSIRLDKGHYNNLEPYDHFRDLFMTYKYFKGPLNNNNFIGLSFENTRSSGITRSNNTITIDGSYNLLIGCRYEGITAIRRVQTYNGEGRRGSSYNEGSRNRFNSILFGMGIDLAYLKMEGSHSGIVLTDTTKAEFGMQTPIIFRNMHKNDDKVIVFREHSPTSERDTTYGYITVDAKASLKQVEANKIKTSIIRFPQAEHGENYPNEYPLIRTMDKGFPDTNSAYNSNNSSVSPPRGSICSVITDNTGFEGQSLFFKSNHTNPNNTGWQNILYSWAFYQRPTAHIQNGYMMIDTSLTPPRPIWYYNGIWIDADGNEAPTGEQITPTPGDNNNNSGNDPLDQNTGEGGTQEIPEEDEYESNNQS